jgi:hypothetical protein
LDPFFEQSLWIVSWDHFFEPFLWTVSLDRFFDWFSSDDEAFLSVLTEMILVFISNLYLLRFLTTPAYFMNI